MLFDDALNVALQGVVKPIKGFFTSLTGAGGIFNAVDGPGEVFADKLIKR